jgi:VWFA-related protein
VFLCVLLPALLAAQAAPPESAGAITVTTHLVEVNVVVTDSKGEPVTDLTQDDFTLLEDGKKQKIASFVLHRRAATTSASGQPPEQLPPGVYTNRMQADTGPLTILLLDVLNTPFLDQAYARNQLLKYLKTQHRPGQKTAIFALTNDLLLLQDFTADTEVLRAALERRGPQESRLLDDPNRDQLVIPNLDPRGLKIWSAFRKKWRRSAPIYACRPRSAPCSFWQKPTEAFPDAKILFGFLRLFLCCSSLNN